MKKIMILLFISIFLISFVSAVNECGNDNSYLGTFKLDSIIDLKQTCDDCTYVNLSAVTYPNSTTIYYNLAMTKNGIEFSINSTETKTLGCYSYTVYGDKGGTKTSETIDYIITSNGKIFEIGNAVSYIGFIIILLFIFLLTVYGAIKVKWKHPRNNNDEIIHINNFRYIKVFLFSMAYLQLMFLSGLSYKLFNEANMEGFTEFFNFVYQLFLNLLYPLIIVLVIIFFLIWINNIKLKKKMELGL